MPEVESVYLASQLAGQFTSVDRGLKREEIRGRIEAALQAMNPNDREIIAMRHYEELSTSEIASILDMTRSGVLKRYRLAIQRLGKAVGSMSDLIVRPHRLRAKHAVSTSFLGFRGLVRR